MKKNVWLKYLLITALILLAVFWEDNVLDGYLDLAHQKMIVHPVILEFIFYVILGLLLGLDHFIQEMGKVGKWRINMAKLVLLGIPSLYFSFGYFIYFRIGKLLPHALTYPIVNLINNSRPSKLPVFQIILGYCIITVFVKNERRNRNR